MEGELTLLIGLDPRIGKGMLIVDEEAETIGIHFNGIHIVGLRMDRAGTSLGWSRLETQIVGIMRVDGLIGDVVVIEPSISPPIGHCPSCGNNQKAGQAPVAPFSLALISKRPSMNPIFPFV